jgi:hypothetical protein
MNVLQMKSMLGIRIGIDPIGSGFVHESFLLLVEELLAYQREKKSIIQCDLNSNRRTTATGRQSSSSGDDVGYSERLL